MAPATPDRALARSRAPEVPDPVPAELVTLITPGAVEDERMQVGVDGVAAPPSSPLAYGSGLRLSRRSDHVLCTAVTAPALR